MRINYLLQCLSRHKMRTMSLVAALMTLSALPAQASSDDIDISPASTITVSRDVTDFNTQAGGTVDVTLTSNRDDVEAIAFTVNGTTPTSATANATTFTVKASKGAAASIGTLKYADGSISFTPASDVTVSTDVTKAADGSISLGERRIVTVTARSVTGGKLDGRVNLKIYRLANADSNLKYYYKGYFSANYGLNHYTIYENVATLKSEFYTGPLHFSCDHGATWQTVNGKAIPEGIVPSNNLSNSDKTKLADSGWTIIADEPMNYEIPFVNKMNSNSSDSYAEMILIAEDETGPLMVSKDYNDIDIKNSEVTNTLLSDDAFLANSTSDDYLNYRHNDGTNINNTPDDDLTWWLSPDWTFSNASSKVETIDDNWDVRNRSAEVVSIEVGSTATQTVSGLTTGDTYKVQAVVRAISNGTPVAGKAMDLTLGGSTTVKGSCISGASDEAWVNGYGRVDNFVNEDNAGWRLVDASVKASPEGKLTITFTAPKDAQLQVSDVTLLKNPDTGEGSWHTVGIPLKQDEISASKVTEVDLLNEHKFSFFRIGDNANAICYSNPLTVIGMKEAVPLKICNAAQSSPTIQEVKNGPKKIDGAVINKIFNKNNYKVGYDNASLKRNNAIASAMFPLTDDNASLPPAPRKVPSSSTPSLPEVDMNWLTADYLALTDMGSDGSMSGDVFRTTGHPFGTTKQITTNKVTYDRSFKAGKKYIVVFPFDAAMGKSFKEEKDPIGNNYSATASRANLLEFFGEGSKAYTMKKVETSTTEKSSITTITFEALKDKDIISAYKPFIIVPGKDVTKGVFNASTDKNLPEGMDPSMAILPINIYASKDKTLQSQTIEEAENNGSLAFISGTLTYQKIAPYGREAANGGSTNDYFDKSWHPGSAIPDDAMFVNYGYNNGVFNIANRINGANLKPFHGYVTKINTKDSKAKEMMNANFVEPSTTTGISEIATEVITPADNRIFSIDGRLVSVDGNAEALQPGMYIMNGKKFIVK